MAYVVPNTFVDGYAVDALPITQNFKELSEYINSDVNVTDIDDGSVETKHIVRPSFFQITGLCNGSYLETGGIEGMRVGALAAMMNSYVTEMPVTTNGFISKWFSSEYDVSATPLQKDVTTWRMVPKTGMTFWVEKASRVHIEYSGELCSPDGNTGAPPISNKACIAVNGDPKAASIVMWTECDKGATYCQDNMRRHFSTFYSLPLTRGWHSCGIISGLNANIAFVGAINAHVEIVNISNT